MVILNLTWIKAMKVPMQNAGEFTENVKDGSERRSMFDRF